jgi:hypothetical protein
MCEPESNTDALAAPPEAICELRLEGGEKTAVEDRASCAATMLATERAIRCAGPRIAGAGSELAGRECEGARFQEGAGTVVRMLWKPLRFLGFRDLGDRGLISWDGMSWEQKPLDDAGSVGAAAAEQKLSDVPS